MFLKRQKKHVTWVDPREATPPFNKIVLIAFGEDKNVYIGFYTNGNGWRCLTGLYAGISGNINENLCIPLYWAYLPDVPKF